MGASYEWWHHEWSEKRLLRLADAVVSWTNNLRFLNPKTLVCNPPSVVLHTVQRVKVKKNLFAYWMQNRKLFDIIKSGIAELWCGQSHSL